MKKCRICESAISPFMSFGQMPIANGFLTADQFDSEYFYELAVVFCDSCGMVQIVDQPEPDRMFHDNYAYFASTSAFMTAHFRKLAERLIANNLGDDPFVIEIGSNDGIMLKNFASAGIRHLGIEPSANVAEVARENGVETLCAFFGADLAKEIVEKHGQADIFFGSNVMCHIPDLHSVFSGVELLLKPDGVMIFEDPYLGDVIEKTSYDQLYDEHVFLFSAMAIKNVVERHGLELIDLEHLPTHGGSMRYFIGRRGRHVPTAAVAKQLEKETALGLNRPETFERFKDDCERSRRDLMALLEKLSSEGTRVVGYGATSKSTTVMNYCGITPEHIEFISDTTPTKQGKFTPGSHIPVKPYEAFQENYPDYALLFAWNHKTEIVAKEQEFLTRGGQWIIYVPAVEISK